MLRETKRELDLVGLVVLVSLLIIIAAVAHSIDSSGLYITKDIGNGLYSTVDFNQIRKNGMPTRMWHVKSELMDLLSERVGKSVYIMPDKTHDYYTGSKCYSYDLEPIETKLVAVYHGIEMGNDESMVLVGAVSLAKDFNNHASFSHHQTNYGVTLLTNPVQYSEPSVSCSFNSWTNPNEVYLDKSAVYEKLLSIYKANLEGNLSSRDTYAKDMDKDKDEIEAAILRVEKALEE